MVDYQLVKQAHSSPELGNYISYGIHGFSLVCGQCVEDYLVSDISTSREVVSEMKNRYIVFGLSPIHLLDVVMDELA